MLFPVQNFYKHLLLFFPIFSVRKRKVTFYLSNKQISSHGTLQSFRALDYFWKLFHFSALGKPFRPGSLTSLRDYSLDIMLHSPFSIHQQVSQDFVLISLFFTFKDFGGLNCNLYANDFFSNLYLLVSYVKWISGHSYLKITIVTQKSNMIKLLKLHQCLLYCFLSYHSFSTPAPPLVTICSVYSTFPAW